MPFKMTNSNPPCHGCIAPKRHLGCHGTCPEYIEWKKELSAYREKERREKSDIRYSVEKI